MSEPRYPYVHVEVPAEQADAVANELWERGAGGVEERDESTLVPGGGDAPGGVTLIASFAEEGAAEAAREALVGRFDARLEFVVGDAWAHAWRAHFKPTRIGERLVIRPSWESVDPAPHEVVLTIDPGNAFGSGIHETTRLVLREVDRRVAGGERVLDVGCGSGILAIAALLLGAERAVAVDVDADAVRVTHENARDNAVAERLEASTLPIERVEGSFDLVLANIQADVLATMVGALTARVAPGALLVLSGILREQADQVRAAFAGLTELGLEEEGEWIAMIYRR